MNSHAFSVFLTISRYFSLFLVTKSSDAITTAPAARSNRSGFSARLHPPPGQAGTATAFRVIPSYYELFRVQKADRGTSRPAACPNPKGARLYTWALLPKPRRDAKLKTLPDDWRRPMANFPP